MPKLPRLDEVLDEIYSNPDYAEAFENTISGLSPSDADDYIWECYEESTSRLKRINGAKCWRSVVTALTATMVEHEPIGIFWTLDRSAATAVDPASTRRDDVLITYEAEVGASAVDYFGTVCTNVVFPDEAEVRIRRGAKLMVRSAEIRGLYSNDLYGVVPVNKMMRC